jgi:hypothetical protein
MLLKFRHLVYHLPLRVTLRVVAAAQIPCVSVAVGQSKSREGFLMQMSERERIYKSGYHNLEIV